jgi:hypothetical protein
MDTNSIMEAHRVKCWNAITTFFQIETVEECQKSARAATNNVGSMSQSRWGRSRRLP